MPHEKPPVQAGANEARNRPRFFAIIGLALVLGTFALYVPTGRFGFVNYDDTDYVSENATVQNGLGIEGVGYAFTETGMSDWYPVLYLSYMTDVTLFGPDNPSAHHLVNAVFHAANVLLLFLLMARWSRAPLRSGFVAALFAFHPLHVESVAWISMRKDVLSTFFWLLAMGAYGVYARDRDHSVHWAWGWYLAVSVLFIAGCLTKANVVTLPCAFLLLDYWPLRRFDPFAASGGQFRRSFGLVLEKAPWIMISLVIAGLHLQITGETVKDLPDLSIFGSGAIAIVSYAGYLLKFLRPIDLACWYPHPAELDTHFLSRPDFLLQLAAAGIVLITITVLVVWQHRRRPYLTVGWFWYLVTLAPASGLVNFASFYLADRYVYIPLWGIYWILAWGGHEILTRLKRTGHVLAPVGAALTIGACFFVSWQQVQVWRDSRTLMRHAISVTENNHFAHNNLGTALAAEGRWHDALHHYRSALQIEPDDITTLNNIGTALQQLGKITEAIDVFQRALQIDSDSPETHYHLGNANLRLERYQQAVRHFVEALRLDPTHAEAHNNLGNALQMLGRLDTAMGHYREALRIDPDYAEPNYNLANCLVGLGRLEEAMTHYRRALRIKPDYAEAHNNMGNILKLRGQPEEALRHYREAVRIRPEDALALANQGEVLLALKRFDEAIGSFREALRIQPDDIFVLNALGSAHAARGDFNRAVACLRKALLTAPESAKPLLRERLEAYKSGKIPGRPKAKVEGE